MEINISIPNTKIITLNLNKNDSIQEIRKKIIEKLIIEKIPHDDHSFELTIEGETPEDNQKLSDFDIEEGDYILVNFYYSGGGYIDNLKEESKKELAQKIGFDMNLIKRMN